MNGIRTCEHGPFECQAPGLCSLGPDTTPTERLPPAQVRSPPRGRLGLRLPGETRENEPCFFYVFPSYVRGPPGPGTIHPASADSSHSFLFGKNASKRKTNLGTVKLPKNKCCRLPFALRSVHSGRPSQLAPRAYSASVFLSLTITQQMAIPTLTRQSAESGAGR